MTTHTQAEIEALAKSAVSLADWMEDEGMLRDKQTIQVLRDCARLLAATDGAEAVAYATRLATILWEKHWSAKSPGWKPLPDLVGVLTQIDNMTANLAPPAPEVKAEYEIIGTTYDGVNILAPAVKSKNFSVEEIRKAVRLAVNPAPEVKAEARVVVGSVEWLDSHNDIARIVVAPPAPSQELSAAEMREAAAKVARDWDDRNIMESILRLPLTQEPSVS